MTLDRNSSRYPYTYSADWIRICGKAESRADAAQWAAEHCEKNGLDLEAFKRSCADNYISYYNDLEAVEARKAQWGREVEEEGEGK